jgi:ribosomal protein S18 acetylase RimI-like enzyme
MRPIKNSDIDDVIGLQARVWQNHFLRERGQEVPLMKRTHQNVKYYLEKEPQGCFVAEADGQPAGVIFSHIWGSMGWFGPLEVEPNMQGKGIGKALVAASVDYLRSRGCVTIGLETMAGSARNLAFYHKLGFSPVGMSFVFYKGFTQQYKDEFELSSVYKHRPNIAVYRSLWGHVLDGLDYGVEMHFTREHDLGQIINAPGENNPGHAILHTYSMFDSSRNTIIKLLVAKEGDVETATQLLRMCESVSIGEGKTGIFIRTYMRTPPSTEFFFERGYLLQGTLMRMLCQGPDEKGDVVHVSCMSG